MNKKPTILAVAALGSLAMIGTGFAGWVITAQVQADIAGNVSAMAVTDNRVVDADFSPTSLGTIAFGKPAQAVVGQGVTAWLTAGENDPVDTLELSSVLSIEMGDNTHNPAISAPVFLVTTGETTNANTEDGAWATALARNVIAAPKYSLTAATFDSTNGVYKTTLTVKFGYGDAFKLEGAEEPTNPYNYYNNSAYTNTAGDDAKEKLGYLYALNGLNFKLTFSISDGVDTPFEGVSNVAMTAVAAD